MARDKSVIQVVVTGEASRLQKAMKGAGGILGTFAGIGIKAAAVTAQLATAIGVAGVRQFANFDAAMQKSVSIMGDVSETMRKDMSDAAREVAKTTQFSAEQAAESYFFLASAGLSAEQSIAALPQVAAFAQAGMFDMARATDLLTDAQSALGMTSEDTAENLAEMTRLSDVLVAANTLANASVSQFSEALTNKAGAALKVMNKDVEEGVAALALLADQGVKGSEAGEKLSVMLRDVTRAVAKSPEKFEALGLNVLDAEGNLRNLADVTDEFTNVLGGMSDAQVASTLDNLGLTRSVGDVIRQMLGGGDAIREYEAALRDAGGTTEEVASKQLDTFNGQLGLLKSAVGDVFLSIGERLVPVFSDLVKTLQENMPAIEAFIDKMLDGFDNYVMPVLVALASFIKENVGPALSEMGGFFTEKVVPAARDMAEWFKGNVLPVLETLWDIVKNDVYPAFRTFADFVLDVIVPAIKNFLEPVLEGLNRGFERIRDSVRENRDGFAGFFDTLRPFFEWIRDTGAPIIGNVLGAAFQGLGVVIDIVITALSIAFDWLGKVIDKIHQFISAVAETALGRGISRVVDAVAGRQYGGLVTPNRPFLVGEQGPEMFVPMGAGRIMPEVPMMVPEIELNGGTNRGGDTYVINVSGAIDPENTARQIRQILQDAERRTGVRL